MIEINNLNFSYAKNKEKTINNLNFKVADNFYLSIIGENGSGKSTLVKLILGILKSPKGSIKVDTTNIGYVPQRLDNFNSKFPITVLEMLNCHMKAKKIKIPNEIERSLNLVSMNSCKNSLIGNLSGGQIQKIFIARALIGNPKLLILDEPTTGIDEKTQEDILNILSDLNKSGTTIITVEHNITRAYSQSSHILKLQQGKGSLFETSTFIKNMGENYATI
ncbi:MAG: metal ABC transporter ATP-binding protein [Clostridiaceae bacterium]